MFKNTKENELKDKKCLDCGHEWRTRVKEPKQCPKCTHALFRQANKEPTTQAEVAPAEQPKKKFTLTRVD